jgi:type I restriction enzyme M protein
MRNGKGKAANA